MKEFRCKGNPTDFLTVEEGADKEGVLVDLYSGPYDSYEVLLDRKDTLRLARHLIKLAEKMDD